VKRLVSLGISLSILAFIYWRVDLAAVGAIFAECRIGWLALALAMVVPTTFGSAWRLQRLMPPGWSLGLPEATRLILVASVLNLFLPSKMGDIAKSHFMRRRGHISGSLALSLVIVEKTFDILALLLLCGVGLFVFPGSTEELALVASAILASVAFGSLLIGSRRFTDIFFAVLTRVAPEQLRAHFTEFQGSWREMHSHLWRRPANLAGMAVGSVLLWGIHMVQIWLFIVALNGVVPFMTSLALTPLAILAGLLPLTIAGVGTRDVALITLYQPYFAVATGAALGLLCTTRYLLPVILGLPFITRYWSQLSDVAVDDAVQLS
jgi:uncharacterized protein (TIRG00374 family)